MNINTDFIRDTSFEFTSWYKSTYMHRCESILRVIPDPINEVLKRSVAIQDLINSHDRAGGRAIFDNTPLPDLSFSPDDLPIIKRFILFKREKVARDVFKRLDQTTDVQTRLKIESELTVLDEILNAPELSEVTPFPLPSISNYLNSGAIKDLVWFSNEWTDLDAKFGLIQSGSALFALLDTIKQKCSYENAPLSVAFFDIDNFKSINTEYTEQVVDREILPTFMAHMVSQFKWHSFLFRQGGDEYVVVMPYFKPAIANEFLREYQKDLGIQRFGRNNTKISVSIGVIHCNSNSTKCAHEIVQLANDKKQEAKLDKGSICECQLPN